MPSCFVLGLDLGTTGVRALLFKPNGHLAASAYTAFKQYYPQPGWVEHDPNEIFSCIVCMIHQACKKAGIHFHQISAIGITNQRETIVLWDKQTGQPAARAIVWQDRRTEPLCELLKKRGFEKQIRQKTGLVLDPYFSATKINWLLKHISGLRAKVKTGRVLAGTIDSWILWRLTGRHATDYTNASRTLLFNIHTRKWDTQLLKLFNIPKTILPEVLPSGGLFGTTIRSSGLAAGVPVYAVLGDQQASLYGQNCTRPGQVKNTYGTGCFMMMNVGKKKHAPIKGILTTLAADKKGQPVYALEGAVFIGGAVVQWLRDGLKVIVSAGETERLARSVSDTHGLTFVPAFAGLGSPHWRSDIRGAMLGLTQGVTRAHLVRAALEAIAQQSADVFEVMQQACLVPIREIRTDGKAVLNRFLMQYQSNLIGLPVQAATQAEVTAWGVVCLAGEMIGFWKKNINPRRLLAYRLYKPVSSSAQRQKMRWAWKKNIQLLLSSPR